MTAALRCLVIACLLANLTCHAGETDCPLTITDNACVCEASTGVGYDVLCPNRTTISLHLHYQESGHLWLNCEPHNPTYFTDIKPYLDRINLGSSLELLRLLYCLIPDESIRVYTDTLGISRVKELHLYYTNFSLTDNKVIEGHFLGVPNVTNLIIESSGVTSLAKNAFKGLRKLESLKLSNNDITVLDESAFESLESLVSLDLGENRLTSVSNDLLVSVPNLKKLEINLKRLDRLPVNFFKSNPKINQLTFHHGGKPGQTLFTSQLLKPLTSLRNVVFQNVKGIESLPAGLFQHNGKLETFEWTRPLCTSRDASNHCQLNLSNIFHGEGAINLREVIINKRMLKSRPPVQLLLHQDIFSGAGNLTKLVLNAGGVESLPENLLRDTKKLKHFEMKSNKMTTLPSLSNCISLETLLVRDNLIAILNSNAFQKNRNLKVLDLSRNKLTSMPNRIFSNTPHLEALDLSHNGLKIQDLETQLSRNINLKNVSLANNSIEMGSLPYNWKHKWLKVENIDLSKNLIGHLINLEDWNFSLRTKKVQLNLSNNRIVNIRLPHNSDGQCSDGQRQTIDISGNPIGCDCYAHNMIKQIHEDGCSSNIKLEGTGITCASPSELIGVAALTLSMNRLQCRFTKGACSVLYTPSQSLQEITCPANSKVTIPHTNNRTHLVLHSAESLSVIKQTVPSYDTLTSLTLSDNNLKRLSVDDLPTNLTGILALDGNLFKEFDPALLAKLHTLQKITLSRNPFYCDCRSVGLYKFVRENKGKILDYNEVSLECNMYLNQTNSTEEFCVDPVEIILPIIVTIMCVLVIFILCLYHREKIFIWLYSNPKTRKFFLDDPVGKDLPYDVFVSYAHQDADFVEGKLVPGLEESPNIKYKCIVHVRDFVPGRNISEQVIEAVDSSRKTLVCLSKHFLASDWSKLEFEAAHARKRVVLVLAPGTQLPTKVEMGTLMHEYISANTYLDANDPWFWEKLRYTLPHKGRRATRATFLGMRTRRRVYSEQMNLVNPSITQVGTSPATTPTDMEYKNVS